MLYIGLSYYRSLLLLLLFLAVLADLWTDRIPNGFLATGMVVGLVGSYRCGPGLFCSAASAALAFLLLYPLFKIGTLGAGDLKTLIMTGCFLKMEEFLTVLAAAFVVGGVFSLIKLFVEHNGRERFACLLAYATEVIREGHWKLYEENTGGEQRLYDRNKIHFTVPVLFGAALRIGGLI